tara:strand:- start:5964 stop:7526 length:1563 start_codon:yes stop_codon:yes gene_type:complete
VAIQNLTPTPEEITNSKGETIKYNITLDDKSFEWKATIIEYTDKDGNAKTINSPDIFQKNNFVSQSVLSSYGLEDDQLKSVEQKLLSLALLQGMVYPAGYIAPPWAKAFNSNNKNPLTSPSSNSSNPQTPAQTTGSSIGNFADLLDNLLPGFNLGSTIETIVNTPNALDKLGQNDKYAPGSSFDEKTVLVYPIALKGNLEHKMDTCVITQFNYQAPNELEFIEGKSAQNIFKDGLLQGAAEGRYKDPKGMVILPMPQSFQEERGVKYGEDTMNTLAAGVTQSVLSNTTGYLAAGALTALGQAGVNIATGGGQGTTFGLGGIGGGARTGIAAKAIFDAAQGVTSSESGKQLLSTVVSSNILKAAGINVSAETILARGAGIVPNPNMELLFRSPLLRNFGLAYRMTARSQAEAAEIRRIIRFFKQGMSPRNQINDGQNFFLKTPNVFGVSFRTTRKEENKGMPKFKTCALRKFTTDYSPDRMWSAYDDGQPVSVTIVMEFGELTPIYSGDFNDYKDLDDIGY